MAEYDSIDVDNLIRSAERTNERSKAASGTGTGNRPGGDDDRTGTGTGTGTGTRTTPVQPVLGPKRGRPAKPSNDVNADEARALVVAIFAVAAIGMGPHWLVDESEVDQTVADALARTLNKIKPLKTATKTAIDPLVIVFGLSGLVYNRYQLNKQNATPKAVQPERYPGPQITNTESSGINGVSNGVTTESDPSAATKFLYMQNAGL